MDKLIQIKERKNQRLVSARDLYKALGLKGRFSRWVEQNFKLFNESQDFYECTSSTDMPNGGKKPLQDYLLTIPMAKHLAMMARTERGKLIRDYFIEVEKKYKSQKSIARPDSYMIADPIKRAKRWIEEQEAYLEEKKLNEKQAKQLADQESDVVFSKTMLATNHACKVRELAADLTKMGFVIGQNQLYELLRLEHYISKHSTFPMGSKIKCGYFVIRHGVKNGHAWSQTLVMPKGQKNIINKCLRGKWDKAYQQVMANTLDM